jgi:hypothetical protein
MTRADDPDGPLGYGTGDGRLPKLVIVAIAWAGVGAVGLLTALLMRSAGIAVFGVLCVLAGGALYLGQRTREQLEQDEQRLRSDPWGSPEDGEEVDDEHPTRSMSTDDDTTVYGNHEHEDDIVDAEFTEYFDYDQAPADQDDGTGYDEEELAYQRFQADQRARETETTHADDGSGHVIEADDEDSDDEARTSRIPAGAEPEPDTHGGSDGGRR